MNSNPIVIKMKKKKQLIRLELNHMLNPAKASPEDVTKVLFFGKRNSIVDDELWEDIIFSHINKINRN